MLISLCSLCIHDSNKVSLVSSSILISTITMFPDDAELYSRISSIHRSPNESTNPHFRCAVAAEVLRSYAEGRLEPSQAGEVVELIADLPVYRNMIDLALSTGRFQTLGEARNIYPLVFS
jgi:hypothetical protein